MFYERYPNFEKYPQPLTFKELGDIRCNQCGVMIQKNPQGYFEDHVSLTKDWGYGTAYDGQTHKIDICLACYNQWTGGFEVPVEVEGEFDPIFDYWQELA